MASVILPEFIAYKETSQRNAADASFVFVTDHDRQYLRSHVMRYSWSTKQTKRRREKPIAVKTVLKKGSRSRRKSNDPTSNPSSLVVDTEEQAAIDQPPFDLIADESTSDNETGAGDREPCLSLQHYDIVLNDQKLANSSYFNDSEQSNTEDFTTHSSSELVVLGHQHVWKEDSHELILSQEFTDLDPFQTTPLALRASEQALMHHWINVFGTMIFGKPHPSTNPMAEGWIPDALNDKASFQGMLSYAAAHLAHLRGHESSFQAIVYKSRAIVLIQTKINDSSTAYSDSTVAAILRQISIEDRFGSPEIADLHKAGLQKIVQKRGGSASFRGNWSLELLYNWYLITSKPTFWVHRPADETSAHIPAHGNSEFNLGQSKRIKQLKPLLDQFWAFFQAFGLPTPHEKNRQRIPTLPTGTIPPRTLLRLFRTPLNASRGPAHEIIEDTCRLACLFYLATLKLDSIGVKTTSTNELDEKLTETHPAWKSSPETLLWILLRSRGPSIENSERIQRVWSFMEVAKLLQQSSWNVAKNMLVHVLWGELNNTQKTLDLVDGWMSLVTELVLLEVGTE